jgi:bifunctional non-homologous end joining protein LigD
MSLARYQSKRDFRKTSEPRPKKRRPAAGAARPIFVVHKHHATHLHYDFRLQMHGALASWAVPKGPSMNSADKRLAVRVEDHPLEYASFRGRIPKGQYGAGRVEIWDKGTYDLVSGSIRRGELVVDLKGRRLRGQFALVRMRQPKKWLLVKMKK